MEKVVGVNYRQKNEVHCSTKCCGTQALKCVPVTVGHVTGLAGVRLTALRVVHHRIEINNLDEAMVHATGSAGYGEGIARRF